MKKLLLTLALTGLVPVSAWADVGKEEIKRLLAAGASENVVLTYVQKNGPVVRLQAGDLVELRQAGAGDRLLSAILAGPQVPEILPPPPACAPDPVSGGVLGNVYPCDMSLGVCLPLGHPRPVAWVRPWDPPCRTVVPRCPPAVVACRPCVPVCRPVGRPICRPVCRPSVRSCGHR